MTEPVTATRARAARLAVSTFFFANGVMSASILPRLPAIKDSLGLTNGELGAAVAAMPVGGLIAGGLVGVLIARLGSARSATAAGIGAAATLAVLGLAGSWAALAAGFLVLGMFDATMDASMNAHGIGVERVYGRSIFQGFHGMWSAGSMVAGALGALAAAAGLPVSANLALIAAGMAIAVLVASRSLLPRAVADAHPEDQGAPELVHLRNAPRLLWLLVPIALVGILCAVLQGAAATWGAVYLTDILGQPAGIAAMGFVVYMAAMTLGRLTNDRWIDRLGRIAVVRVGAVIGITGLVLVIGSAFVAAPALAFVGYAAIGLGSSPMFPVMAATAGRVPGIPAGYGVALVSWFVRIGLIVAPALVGWTADQVGLTAALLIPLASGLVLLAFAPAMLDVARRVRRAEPAAA